MKRFLLLLLLFFNLACSYKKSPPQTMKLIMVYGQSNSQGAVDFSQTWRTPMKWNEYPDEYTGPTDGEQNITTSERDNVFTLFNLRWTNYWKLIPLKQRAFGTSGEGVAHGLVDVLSKQFPNENWTIVSHGIGSSTIAKLDKPTAAEIMTGDASGIKFTDESGERLLLKSKKGILNILDYPFSSYVSGYYKGMWLIANAKQLAREVGYRLEVPALCWLQGESDINQPAGYAQKLIKLYDDYSGDVQKLTGQTGPMTLLLEQNNYSGQSEQSHENGYKSFYNSKFSSAYDLTGKYGKYLPEAKRINNSAALNAEQLTAVRSGMSTIRPIFIVAPRYPYNSRIHINPHTARRHGEFFAKAYVRFVSKGHPPIQPFMPLAWWIDGQRIFIRFAVPKPPLRLVAPENAVSVAGKGHGFAYSGGTIQPANVVVVAEDLISIKPDKRPVAGQTISYVVSVRSGDLCDSDTVSGMFTERDGSAYQLVNYALPFTLTLN